MSGSRAERRASVCSCAALPANFDAHGRRQPTLLAGLLTFQQPQLPADLNAGFPELYTAKADGVASPVDTIVEAASAAGVSVCSTTTSAT